ncbi:AraC family transcriptional regulator [Caldibacillus lycopersici]|uniref:AraC family transcriptional regulator n=1 Tax=Perspicuibacillus lycopersici TaxID=1325689 RepID=A0AAE3IWU4_9BACI|nr:AraC family transcriptional regulator [Perspicuibacillus lycopersici]MCU9614854.1 AraC family transcriptional regulator [Perspicuibacillus lycopersici]
MTEKVNIYYQMEDTANSFEDFSYHSHEQYEIYYFHSGSCKYLIGDHIYHLQDNDIIIMNGLTLHRAYPEPGIPYKRTVIEFSSEWLRPILNALNVPELLNPFYQLSNTLFRGADNPKLVEINQLMEKLAEKDESKAIHPEEKMQTRFRNGEFTALLLELLFIIYEISQKQPVPMLAIESEKNTHVKRIIEWIDEHFCRPITLDNIASNLNISKYYMSRIFKDITGYTIMQYLMSCRINRAKYLLEIHPEKSILDVALESGFEDSSHFSRFFRKQMKMTPTEYRNSTAAKRNTTNL